MIHKVIYAIGVYAVTMWTLVLFFAVILFLTGCASTQLVRLGPGECVALIEKDSVFAIGSNCQVGRSYR